jgi:hypothetical protein
LTSLVTFWKHRQKTGDTKRKLFLGNHWAQNKKVSRRAYNFNAHSVESNMEWHPPIDDSRTIGSNFIFKNLLQPTTNSFLLNFNVLFSLLNKTKHLHSRVLTKKLQLFAKWAHTKPYIQDSIEFLLKVSTAI